MKMTPNVAQHPPLFPCGRHADGAASFTSRVLSLLVFAVAGLGCGSCSETAEAETVTGKKLAATSSEYGSDSQMHRDALERRRRIMINNDGNDNYSNTLPTSTEQARELFLGKRLNRLLEEGNQIDTIVYETTGSGFGKFFHPPQNVGYSEQATTDMWYCDTETSQVPVCRKKSQQDSNACKATCLNDFVYQYSLNQARGVVKALDPLQETIQAIRKKAQWREVFWGIRMDDTHDTDYKKNLDLFTISKFKKKYPEHLFDAVSDPAEPGIKSTGKSLVAGKWTSVDYATIKVRGFVQESVEDVLKRYDVDGLQFNFMRHAVFFRRNSFGNAANQTEIDKMTDMMRNIRAIADTQAEVRKKPVLISILVPDSLPYARYLGLDLEAWYEEKLVDIVVGSDYMQLTRWSDSVSQLKAINPAVQFYAGLAESRLPGNFDFRETAEAFRGRATEALGQGARGVQITNARWSNGNFKSLYYRIGTKEGASASSTDREGDSDMLFFGSFMGYGYHAGRIPNYDDYFYKVYPITSNDPVKLPAGNEKYWEFGSGKGGSSNYPKNGYIYLRVESLTQEQREGAYGNRTTGLYINVIKADGNTQRLEMDRYYTGGNGNRVDHLKDPDKGKNMDGAAYVPGVLGFRVPSTLLGVPTLKIRVVNSSADPAYLEDLILHTTLADSVPVFEFEETKQNGLCKSVKLNGLTAFSSIPCLP